LNDILAGEYSWRHERHLRWLKSPLAIVALAMVAATFCGLFLHPQGFLLAIGLAGVLGVGIGWPWLSVTSLSGTLGFERTRVREGEPVAGVISIRNRSPLSAWGLAVNVGFGRFRTATAIATPDASIARVAGWRTTRALVEFEPECRGEFPAGTASVSSGFPFGMWTARRELAVGTNFLVWPRVFPVSPIPECAAGHDADGLALGHKPGSWGDLLGVRPYRRGDPLRRIHWPQTARHGQLVVCESQSNAVPRIQIVLDLHQASHAGLGPSGSLEWAIRVAASFAEGWIQHGAEVELLTANGQVVAFGGSVRARSAVLLDALARLGGSVDVGVDALLKLPTCSGSKCGLRLIVTTDLALGRHPFDTPRSRVNRFVVLITSGFGGADRGSTPVRLPFCPWISIDSPDCVARSLKLAGKEVAIVG
jgi:uncharacterized protein (DUF58 family)